MTENQKRLLETARSLIRGGWCKHSFARSVPTSKLATPHEYGLLGKSVAYSSSEANCFCIRGALSRAAEELPIPTTASGADVYHLLAAHLPADFQEPTHHSATNLSIWQDEPNVTKSDVLALFDAAIGD